MRRRQDYFLYHNRTKSRKGFSLMEMLVTVLLMSLATLAIAAGITAAVRTYRSMTLKAEAQTLLGTAIAAVDDDFATADLSTLTIGSNKSEASFYSGNRGYEVHIHNGGDTIYMTDAMTDAGDSSSSVSSGSVSDSANGAIPIVTTKTRTQNLKLQIKDISITPSAAEGSGSNASAGNVSGGSTSAGTVSGTASTGNSGTKLSDTNPYFTYTITVLHGETVVESETVKTAVIAGYPEGTGSQGNMGE
jgi:prepilin-type N-terminal cleavage/methylation domain-containing protein